VPLRSATFMHEALVIKGGAIIERPAMVYKRGLEVYIAKRLMELGCPILYTVHGKGVFEASNLWFLNEKTAIIATGLRTNMEGVNQVSHILRMAGVEEIHIAHLPGYLQRREYQVGGSSGIFHLDMTFGMVDEDLAVIYPGGVDYDTIQYLKQKGINLIEIPEEELLEGIIVFHKLISLEPEILHPRLRPLAKQIRVDHVNPRPQPKENPERAEPGDGIPNAPDRYTSLP